MLVTLLSIVLFAVGVVAAGAVAFLLFMLFRVIFAVVYGI